MVSFVNHIKAVLYQYSLFSFDMMEVLYSLTRSWSWQHKSISQLNSSPNAIGMRHDSTHILYSLQHHSKPACGVSFLVFSFDPIQACLQYILYSFHHHSNMYKIYPLKLSSSLKACIQLSSNVHEICHPHPKYVF
jgi:hypothetical protein